MSPTALDDPRFERVAPTWELARPAVARPAPCEPADRRVYPTVAIGATLALLAATIAVAAAGGVIAGFALGLPMGGGVGTRTPHPQSAAALADGFELAAGTMRLDLRDVAFPRGTTRTKVEVGFGDATVVVPRGVEVVVDGRVVAGEAHLLGRAAEGIGVETTQASSGGRDAPRLEIDARVGFGELRVERG